MPLSIQRLVDYWQTDKNNPTLATDLLKACLRERDWRCFEQVYSHLDKQNLLSHDISLLRAQAYIELKQVTAAKLCLSQLEFEPFKEYLYALCHFIEQDFSAAQHLLHTCVLRLGESAEIPEAILVLRAKCFYQMGQLQQALASLNNYVDMPGYLELKGLYGILAFDLEDVTTARKVAVEVLAQQPEQHDALLTLASIAMFELDAQQTLALCEQALATYPGSGRFWMLKGQALLTTGEFNQALSCLIRASELLPTHLGTFHLLGWCHLLLQEFDNAESAFQQALAINRSFSESHGALAIVYLQRGEVDKTVKTSEKALRLDSACYAAQYALLLLAEKQGDGDKAQGIMSELLKRPSHLPGVSVQILLERLR